MPDKARILLVDDEAVLTRMVSIRLVSAGYEVVTAADGKQALGQAKRLKPDLIILDLMLPKMDGYNVCRLLKYDAHYSKIPVLILTARTMDKDIRLAIDCGADAYLTKPFDAKVLLDRVKQLLEKAQVEKSQQEGGHPHD